MNASLGSTVASMQLLVDPFTAALDVVAFDPRGMGESEVPPGPWTMADHAAVHRPHRPERGVDEQHPALHEQQADLSQGLEGIGEVFEHVPERDDLEPIGPGEEPVQRLHDGLEPEGGAADAMILLAKGHLAYLSGDVDEATRMERLVGAHCHGKRGIMASLEAGVKTIEHGTYLDEEAADAMVETGAILVPTRWILRYLMTEGTKKGMPEYARVKGEIASRSHAAAIALAVEKGVKIAMGTDIWASGLWGKNAEELAQITDGRLREPHMAECEEGYGRSDLSPRQVQVVRDCVSADNTCPELQACLQQASKQGDE